MALRASSTSSILLISKKSHFLTLLLAVYYNYHGPSHYFTLLLQGAPGEGDKEIFTQAAFALGQPIYTVNERVSALGKPIEGGIASSAMAQSDPIEDYRLTRENKWRVKDPAVAPAPRVFFVHASYPKFDPDDNVFGYKWNEWNAGRVWVVGEETIRRFGYDAEKAEWEEMKCVACNFELTFRAWNNRRDVCNKLRHHWEAVFEGLNDDGLIFTDDPASS
jgi:alpha 1,2-mannosyltransferase